MQMAQASAERIMSLVMAESEIKDSTDVIEAMKQDKTANAAIDGHATRSARSLLKMFHSPTALVTRYSGI